MHFKAILKYHLPTSILLFISIITFSQSFTTRLYTTADGLNDNYIYCIYQDSYGYLWIGTPNGLNRFDGKQFTNFGLKSGLPSLSVDKIYEDHNHRLWIGTRAGIAELKGDSCYTYPFNDKQQISFVSGFVEPSAGKLWATTNKGLYEFRKNIWVKIGLYPGYENESIGRIIGTSNGIYINYHNNMVVHRNLDGKYKVLLFVHSNQPYYNNLYQKNDTVYISTYSGFMHLEHDKWIYEFNDTLNKKKIYTSFRDNSNRYWFATKEDGVLVIMPNGKEVNYQHIPLSFNLVSTFFEDRDKNIWVAGFQGLLKVSPSIYNTLSLPEFKNLGFIRNCIALPSGKIVVSGENGKLFIISPASLTASVPKILAIKLLKAPNDFIDFYTFDENERLLFTTREGEIYMLDDLALTNLTSIAVPKNTSFRGLAYNKKTKQLYVCADSVLLAGTENHLDTFFSSKKREIIPVPFIIHMEEDGGSMLVQTLNNGLFLVNSKGEIFKNNEISLFISIHNIRNDKNYKNIIWAVYQGRAILKYRWEKDKMPELLETITEKDGLPDNKILHLAVDREEKLWIATVKGITLMQKDVQQKWIHHDFEFNELGANIPLSFTKLSTSNDGKMWMNVQNKLLIFDALKTPMLPVSTNTLIEKILLFNQPVNWSLITDSFDNYRSLPINPILQHDQNTVSIIYNGLQFINNSQLEYSYRLLPSDKTWSSPTASNIVSFYQLSPGNYHFEVRSHLKGFEWSKPALFSFKIKKPFWETWWFRLALILASSGLIVFIFRNRIKQLKIKSDMVNLVRELEMKAFKAQMNPHFIHNALNSIQSLIINQRSEEAGYYISKFAKLLRQVLENSDKNVISLDKELYSLQLYIDLEKLRMNVEVEYVEHIEETILTSEIKIPPLILQPFVENALWHGLSNKEGSKKISVTITQNENWITCEITDNGIGRIKARELYKKFPEGNLSKATNITRQRLIDFNQSTATEPITFIDLMNNDKPSGTSVLILIRSY